MDGGVNTAMDRARLSLAEIILRDGGCIFGSVPPGYSSGVNFYTLNNLVRVIANAMVGYKRVFGQDPDLINPTTFNEKVVWSKFFGVKKVPESGNKLMTASLLPDSVRSIVRVPQVVWRSDRAILPTEDIKPGTYYLKANHGSGFVRKVQMPLSKNDRKNIENLFSFFLTVNYGLHDGEWWYSTFKREVFLEKSVSSGECSIAWLFYVFSGSVQVVAAYQKSSDGDRSSWFDAQFNLFKEQNERRERVVITGLSQGIMDRMSAAALLIAGAMPFVRVDFLIGDDGNIYISELTHAPGNGLTLWPDEINDRMGREWQLGGYSQFSG